jgi:hypothetical protein
MLMTKRKPAAVGEILVEEFVHAADGPYAASFGRGHGRTAQARQRIVQQARWAVAAGYVESGASAIDDKRPSSSA